MIFIFQVQSLTGSSIPFFSPLEASTPKCFRQQVPWTLSYSRQERYQPPHPPCGAEASMCNMSNTADQPHAKNNNPSNGGVSAACQKQLPCGDCLLGCPHDCILVRWFVFVLSHCQLYSWMALSGQQDTLRQRSTKKTQVMLIMFHMFRAIF